MNSVPIAHEHVPVLRQALAASDVTELRAVGEGAKIMYLVVEEITQAEMGIWEQLIAAGREA